MKAKKTKRISLQARREGIQGARSNVRHSKSHLTTSSSQIWPTETAQTEEQIPELAMVAVAQAAQRARLSGLNVVEVCGNQLVSVSPDGTRTVIKDIELGVRVPVGEKIRLR